MSDNDIVEGPYSPLTREEMAMLMAAEDALIDPRDELPEDGGIETPEKVEQQDRTAVLNAVTAVEAAPTTPKPLVKRRLVTKTQIGHVAQDIIMNTVLALVENFRNDPSIVQRIEELGLTADEFEPTLTKQATRVAKALRFEVS